MSTFKSKRWIRCLFTRRQITYKSQRKLPDILLFSCGPWLLLVKVFCLSTSCKNLALRFWQCLCLLIYIFCLTATKNYFIAFPPPPIIRSVLNSHLIWKRMFHSLQLSNHPHTSVKLFSFRVPTAAFYPYFLAGGVLFFL